METDSNWMRRALIIARNGMGFVEPNPAVGAVIVDEAGRLVGEGWHERFGGPHAEVMALANTGERARGATLYVTLEPCCHFGKTPPCTQAVIAAGIRRVVVGCLDPAAHVNGGGIAELRNAGLTVDVGVLPEEAADLIAPFRMLMTAQRPWFHAKWAMTLDGKLATRTGSSQWISNAASRAVVHQLRGRMDAILVGIGTVLADDPLLTARPAGPRVPLRIVLDLHARLPLSSQLVRSRDAGKVMVVTGPSASSDRLAALSDAGVEVLSLPEAAAGQIELSHLAVELGRRRLTNVLVEGGAAVLGSFFDADLIDEVHTFIAPKIVGGAAAPSPLAGMGLDAMNQARSLRRVEIRPLEGDVYINGRVTRETT